MRDVPFFLVRYRYTDDHAGRDARRPEHKDHLAAAADRGLILGSGPFAAGEKAGAAMIYSARRKDDIVTVVEDDPFYRHGHIASYEITEWIPMIGPWAADARTRHP
ncbi:YciI family protein [Nocardia grenadensis]|uniref:YciI family protein n=1 Tax=Nocardia grenadensis TaxID=931537 RepID=UPI001FE029EF|nr:YciI family protein [Nocardia grenadensis]